MWRHSAWLQTQGGEPRPRAPCSPFLVWLQMTHCITPAPPPPFQLSNHSAVPDHLHSTGGHNSLLTAHGWQQRRCFKRRGRTSGVKRKACRCGRNADGRTLLFAGDYWTIWESRQVWSASDVTSLCKKNEYAKHVHCVPTFPRSTERGYCKL